MKRSIVEVDHARRIAQWTFADERWYARRIMENTMWDFVPSVTWVCNAGYVKGIGFYKWLAAHGWDESEEIKAAAGEKGSKVHQGVARLVAGGTVRMEDCFENTRTGQSESLSPDEYGCLMSFCDWFKEVNPEILDSEYAVWNERYRYAGTVDLKVRIGKAIWLIDLKTSPQVWPTFEIQISAYKHADPALPKSARLAILQLGYKKNKFKKWKFTPIADQFPLFLAARKIWEKEMAGVVPLQRDFPLELKLS